jgi:hypothetical protein
MWNVPAKPTEPSIAAATKLLNERGSSERQVSRYDSGEWREPFAGSQFEELRDAQFNHSQIVDREQLLAYFASMSWIAVLPDNELTDLLDEVRKLLDSDTYTRFGGLIFTGRDSRPEIPAPLCRRRSRLDRLAGLGHIREYWPSPPLALPHRASPRGSTAIFRAYEERELEFRSFS